MSAAKSDPHVELLEKLSSSRLYARSCISDHSTISLKSSSSLSSQTFSSNSLASKYSADNLIPSPLSAHQKSCTIPIVGVNKMQARQSRVFEKGHVSNIESRRSSKTVDEGLACRLHVSNLPFIFREGHLAHLFSPYGIVTDAEVVTNEKGSKGFGFVSLSGPDEAALARSALHGAVVEGRRIEVNQATPRVRPLLASKSPFLALNRQVNKQNCQMLELVEAQTRLAEAQLAVLQMRNAILSSQDQYKKAADTNIDND